MRIERSVQVRAIARLEEPAGPDVEGRVEVEFRHCVQDFDLVRNAVVVRIEHHLDIVGDGSVDVEAGVVHRELVSGTGAIRLDMVVTGLQSAANRNRPQVDLRL